MQEVEAERMRALAVGLRIVTDHDAVFGPDIQPPHRFLEQRRFRFAHDVNAVRRGAGQQGLQQAARLRHPAARGARMVAIRIGGHEPGPTVHRIGGAGKLDVAEAGVPR